MSLLGKSEDVVEHLPSEGARVGGDVEDGADRADANHEPCDGGEGPLARTAQPLGVHAIPWDGNNLFSGQSFEIYSRQVIMKPGSMD